MTRKESCRKCGLEIKTHPSQSIHYICNRCYAVENRKRNLYGHSEYLGDLKNDVRE